MKRLVIAIGLILLGVLAVPDAKAQDYWLHYAGRCSVSGAAIFFGNRTNTCSVTVPNPDYVQAHFEVIDSGAASGQGQVIMYGGSTLWGGSLGAEGWICMNTFTPELCGSPQLSSFVLSSQFRTYLNTNNEFSVRVNYGGASGAPMTFTVDLYLVYDSATYPEGSIRPLTLEDEASLTKVPGDGLGGALYSFLDGWQGESVYAMTSGAERKPVHAATDGTVWTINPITLDDCSLPDSGDGFCRFEYDDAFRTINVSELDNLSVVRVLKDSTTIYEYIVANAEDYIQEGASISAGCVLGETVLANAILPVSATDDTFTAVRSYQFSDGTELSIFPNLTIYPDSSNPCTSQVDNTTGCYTHNADFADGKNGWVTSDGVNVAAYPSETGTIDALWMPRGTSIQQIFDGLDTDFEYEVTVVTIGTGSFTVELGTNSETVSVDTNTYQATSRIRLTPAPAGILHPLKITMASDNPASGVYVFFVCLASVPIDTGVSSSCYFANHNFDNGLTGWAYQNPIGVTPDGFLVMGEAAAIGQQLRLYPTDDLTSHDYTLSVSLAGFTSETPPDIANLNWQWGGIQTGSWAIPDVSYVDIGTSVARLTATITVSSELEETLFVVADLENSDNSPSDTNVLIQSICLTPESGSFPGFAVPVVDTAPVCEAVSRPGSLLNIGEWVFFLWNKIKNWFDCTLLPRMNSMWQSVVDVFSLLSSFFKYIGTLANMIFSWFAGSFVGWLASQFLNLILIIWEAFKGVGSYALVVFERVKLIAEIVVYQVVDMLDRYGSFRNAWELAEPLAIPGTDCNGTEPNTLFCSSIRLADLTVFKDGSQGQIVINLIVAFLSGHLLIWIIGELKRTIRDAGSLI